MKLKLVKSFWGMDGSLEEKMRRIAEAGYAAVEGRVAGIEDLARFQELRAELGLDFVPMVLTEGEDHLADFRDKVEEAARFEPLQITAHCGRDHWTFDRKRAFFAEALEIERRIGIPINHETHRGRALFSAQATAELLRALPELWINADFSHFACVSESLLEDQPENMALCISRARHVHGRVGHEEGPQVSDPRASEWAPQLAAHEEWWDEIVRARSTAGAAVFTFNPEFGPPNYMPTLPHTRQPVSDLWEICLWMAKRFEARYSTLVP
ncbi:MAG: sugar phosphate isomerase/epimerase family protein [Blastocatellia bacterium]